MFAHWFDSDPIIAEDVMWEQFKNLKCLGDSHAQMHSSLQAWQFLIRELGGDECTKFGEARQEPKMGRMENGQIIWLLQREVNNSNIESAYMKVPFSLRSQ